MSQSWKPSEPRPLQSEEVHVWRSMLVPGRLGGGADARLLTPAERARAGSFRQAADAHRFIIARATLRRLLARYVGEAPDRIVIQSTASEKPHVVVAKGGQDVRFNVAHAGALGLFAFALGCEVGVDCETRSSLGRIDAAFAKAFTAAELRALASMTPDRRADEGLRLWTRKEATLKGLGTGLRISPESLEIGISPPTDRPRHVKVRGRRWTLFDLSGLPDAFGSLAVEADAVSLYTGEWDPF